MTIRVDAPKTTALLFSSGKLVITGPHSKQMAIASVRSTVLMLNSIFPHLQISYTNHIVQNIVCNVSFRNLVTIDIQKLHKDFGTSCTFQPSIFPGFLCLILGCRWFVLPRWGFVIVWYSSVFIDAFGRADISARQFTDCAADFQVVEDSSYGSACVHWYCVGVPEYCGHFASLFCVPVGRRDCTVCGCRGWQTEWDEQT